MVVDLEKRTYLLVTGASRGIGQRMAVDVSAKLKAGSLIVLLARSEQGLAQTKASITALGNDLNVITFSIDLSSATATQFQELLAKSLDGTKASNFERAFIIHNAGSVGDVSKSAIDVSDTTVWQQYYHMNVFSVISLNCEFFRAFNCLPKIVVNISSKCGIEPYASMSFYCSGKAARNMYFRVLATEQADEDVVVLNYAPGAIDTDMTVLVQRESINKELAGFFKMQRDTKTMLTTEQTTKKFLLVLEAQKFKSGDHVDYWDE
ncbi:PREDICTED: sepiapterin reductase isoform X1 [Rhagoletis zephyria]|uniref:sepiapterin reductase isoform X1 n=1 Tax=Rhagoletis zephyria TaxID=28612 RepID=UPI0008118CED|nr:PREDICTED: sepiapterin reductase isoform X1 [Rhagoletis zephyria]XP_017479942.1 PREDICTED: sepiapterin reductase isoform X1 [Rhagoletis zephyria]